MLGTTSLTFFLRVVPAALLGVVRVLVLVRAKEITTNISIR